MDLKGLLYKNDEYTGEYRISKTKLVTCIMFVIFFIFAMYIYLTDGQFAQNSIVSLFAAVIVGAVFAVPTYIIGLLISKILYRDKADQITSNMDFNNYNRPCSHDYAVKFKGAVEANDGDLAGELLASWDKNDANYKYASLIYEGMPPTKLSKMELFSILNQADKMTACDESLRHWYRSTAMEVINLNNQ